MSKKPRRKYNPERNYARAARHATKPLAMVYTLKNQPMLVNAATHKRVTLTEALYRAFHTVQYKWTVYTAVMLETSTGERYASIRECSPERPCYKEDIADALKERHIEHTKSTKKSDRVNLGWVAFPIECDVSEAEIVKLLELFPDCWDRHERGCVLLDEELSTEQQLERLLSC